MNRCFLVFMGLTLLLVRGAYSQEQGDDRLKVFEPTLQGRIQSMVDSARRSGIPTEPLIDVALKGRSMSVSGETIVQVVRQKMRGLETAKAILVHATAAELDAAAAALGAGADPRTLVEMRRRRPSAVLTMPFGLLESFMRRGMARDTAQAVMLILTESTMDDAEMSEFWRIVLRDIAVGILPSASAAARVESFTTRDLGTTTAPATGPPTGTPPPPARPIPPQRP
jgi:hypothetical protein